MKNRIAVALALGILAIAIPSVLELILSNLSIEKELPGWLMAYLSAPGTTVTILLFGHGPTVPKAVWVTVLYAVDIIFQSLVAFGILTLIDLARKRRYPRD